MQVQCFQNLVFVYRFCKASSDMGFFLRVKKETEDRQMSAQEGGLCVRACMLAPLSASPRKFRDRQHPSRVAADALLFLSLPSHVERKCARVSIFFHVQLHSSIAQAIRLILPHSKRTSAWMSRAEYVRRVFKVFLQEY